MKGKKLIKKTEIVPDNLKEGVICQKITSDFVLEIYEKAKRARSKKRKQDLHRAAENLSKHIGKWLVE